MYTEEIVFLLNILDFNLSLFVHAIILGIILPMTSTSIVCQKQCSRTSIIRTRWDHTK